MVELSNERIEQILHDETKKTEALPTILRGVYIRYLNLYENYIADYDKLNDDKIAEFGKQNEETKSLVKYYYMDIPQDVCEAISEFEEKVGDKLLGREWKRYLYELFDEFKSKCKARNMSEDYYKAEFKKQVLKEFYACMDNIFRDGFGTGSQTTKDIVNGITGLLFGKKEK